MLSKPPLVPTNPMKQFSFTQAEFASKKKLTRRERFLREMGLPRCT